LDRFAHLAFVTSRNVKPRRATLLIAKLQIEVGAVPPTRVLPTSAGGFSTAKHHLYQGSLEGAFSEDLKPLQGLTLSHLSLAKI
jgi:hypothetical protein